MACKQVQAQNLYRYKQGTVNEDSGTEKHQHNKGPTNVKITKTFGATFRTFITTTKQNTNPATTKQLFRTQTTKTKSRMFS